MYRSLIQLRILDVDKIGTLGRYQIPSTSEILSEIIPFKYIRVGTLPYQTARTTLDSKLRGRVKVSL